jgi:hypothetical protein
MLAVEFPSPCDRSAIADCRRSVFAGLDKENSGPLRRNAISTAKLSPKRLGLSIGLVIREPQRGQNHSQSRRNPEPEPRPPIRLCPILILVCEL